MTFQQRANKAIETGLGNGEFNPYRMLAAIEGTIMGACYSRGIKANKRFITIEALSILIDGVGRLERAEALGLSL